MFHIGRCGSTVLADLLHQNRKICWDGEIYQQYFESLDSKGVFITTDSLKDQSPLDLLQKSMRYSGPKFYGLEIKFYHLRCFGIEMSTFVNGLEKLGVNRFILLERKNYLRKVVSSVVARKAHRYHLKQGSTPELIQVKIDPHDVDIDYDRKPLLELLLRYRDDSRALQYLMNGRPFLELSYEDDINVDPRRAYSRVCEFLGLPPTPVIIRYVRTTPYPLRDVIVNFSEVEIALAGSEFSWMLRD